MKYQVLHGKRDKVIVTLRRMQPTLQIAPDTVFVMHHEKQFEGWSPKYLFEGRLKYVTPLVWLMFIASFMTSFFLLSWLLGLAHQREHPALEGSDFRVHHSIGIPDGCTGPVTNVGQMGYEADLGIFHPFGCLRLNARLCGVRSGSDGGRHYFLGRILRLGRPNWNKCVDADLLSECLPCERSRMGAWLGSKSAPSAVRRLAAS